MRGLISVAFRGSDGGGGGVGGKVDPAWAGSQSRGEKKLERGTTEAHGATARTSGSLCERSTPRTSVWFPSQFPGRCGGAAWGVMTCD